MSSTNIDENIGEEVKVLLEDENIKISFFGTLEFRNNIYFIKEYEDVWIQFSATDVDCIDANYIFPLIHLRRTA